MRIKVKNAERETLDWLVTKAEGWVWDARFTDVFLHQNRTGQGYCYSRDWSLAGPIIEREYIELTIDLGWIATRKEGPAVCEAHGATPLIAAMRCYVTSRLGDEVDVPNELINQGEATC